jgi:hypothetical protein
MIRSFGFHEESKAQNVDKSNIRANVGIVNMKYPSNKRLSSDDCSDGGGSGIGQLVTTPDTRRTRKTGYKNQPPVGPVAPDFDCKPPEYSGLLYGILKCSIIGGP